MADDKKKTPEIGGVPYYEYLAKKLNKSVYDITDEDHEKGLKPIPAGMKEEFTAEEIAETSMDCLSVASFALTDSQMILCFDVNDDLVMSLPVDFIEEAYKAIQKHK